jgi:tripartite-type tricarboxylate transporter receptor subunit TctC
MMLEKQTGAKFEYVHNNGAPQQIMQLLGGYTDVGLMAYGECQSQVKEGKFTVLAVASEERSRDLPDVPTFRELGIELVYGAWRGIAAPAGLPQPILQHLAAAFQKGIDDPVFRERMAKAGYPVINRGPAGFAEYMNNDAAAVTQIFKELGIGKAK